MNARERLYRVVFHTDTKAGRRFDVWLLWVILFSVLLVMLESVPEIGRKYYSVFFVLEWIMTIIFTIEYVLRIWISPNRTAYVFSFWGIIDALSILPTYLRLFVFGYHYLIVVRIFRLLRVFRILKLARFNRESIFLAASLKHSAHKIGIFMMAVIAIVVFLGTIMYVVEGGEKGFTSIPQSIYWAIVTVTTVGYGDMVPQTVVGKFISSLAMIIGYAIIAVPTGIITMEMSRAGHKKKKCHECNFENEERAGYCGNCGAVIGGGEQRMEG